MRVEGNLLDALAIVAFRQPVTRAAADSLKGGDTGPALRQLVRLGLVAQQGEPRAFMSPPRLSSSCSRSTASRTCPVRPTSSRPETARGRAAIRPLPAANK